MELKLQPNECRCDFTEHEHILALPQCCPVSGNPQAGSTITIAYRGTKGFLEVAALRVFVDSYIGGKGEVRSMEGMLQEIAQACADILKVDVKLSSNLIIEPKQIMRVTCYAFPNEDLHQMRQNEVVLGIPSRSNANGATNRDVQRLRARTKPREKICSRGSFGR